MSERWEYRPGEMEFWATSGINRYRGSVSGSHSYGYLAAAAPEMLEALKSIVLSIEDGGRSGTRSGTGLLPALRAARAAIAAAERGTDAGEEEG